MFGGDRGSITKGVSKINSPVPAFDIIYYRYGYDSLTHTYFAKDSIKQHNSGGKVEEPDTASYLQPEGPHKIKNLSNVTIDVYRVEFKTGIK